MIFYWLVTILLVTVGADRPVDFERKIHVRMAWPGATPQLKDSPQQFISAASFSRQMLIRFPSSGSNGINKAINETVEPKKVPFPSSGSDATAEEIDYPLDSYVSLSLSSGGSDAEGAEKSSRSGKSASSKVDLLQQLLRLAPAAVESGTYDKCNHPLHSWRCNKEEPRVTTNPPPSTKQPEVFPGASFDNVQIFFAPEVTTTTSRPLPPSRIATEHGSWAGADPCTHPFHSWMCSKQRPKALPPPKPEASRLDENLLLPPTEATTTTTTSTTTTRPPPTTTTRKSSSGWDGADPCTHPFHSWLCGKRPPAVPRTTLPPPTTTLQPFVPDASFFIPELDLPPPPPTTTPPPSIIVRTLAPKKGWDEADSCSHPFHSWLCAKPKVRTTTPPPPTTTTTTTTTTPPPRREEAVIFEPAPSNDQGNQLVPDATPPPTTTPKPVKAGWDEADSCSHPFHSWLCAKPQDRTTPRPTTKPPPTTTRPPPPPLDLQVPDASNFGNLETFPLVVERPTTQKPVAKSSGWEGADPCTHPFHSWLCNRSPPIKQNLKSALRIGRQSATAIKPNEEDEDVESSRWEHFESLRLLPSGGRKSHQ